MNKIKLFDYIRRHEIIIIKWCNRITFCIGIYLFFEKYTFGDNIIFVAVSAFWQIKTAVILFCEFIFKLPLYYILSLNLKKSFKSALPVYGPMYTH